MTLLTPQGALVQGLLLLSVWPSNLIFWQVYCFLPAGEFQDLPFSTSLHQSATSRGKDQGARCVQCLHRWSEITRRGFRDWWCWQSVPGFLGCPSWQSCDAQRHPESWGFQGLTQEFVQKEVNDLTQVLGVFSMILFFHKYSGNTTVSVTGVLVHISKPGNRVCFVSSHIFHFNAFIFLNLTSGWENPPPQCSWTGCRTAQKSSFELVTSNADVIILLFGVSKQRDQKEKICS